MAKRELPTGTVKFSSRIWSARRDSSRSLDRQNSRTPWRSTTRSSDARLAQAAASPDDFERAAAAGRAMDIESAVAEALAIGPSPPLAFERWNGHKRA